MGDEADDASFRAEVFDRGRDDLERIVVERPETFVEKERLEARRAFRCELGGLLREREREGERGEKRLASRKRPRRAAFVRVAVIDDFEVELVVVLE